MAEVSIDIAKETSVEAVKDDTTAIKSDVTTVKGDVAEVKTDTAAIKSDVTKVKSNVSTVRTDVSLIKTQLLVVQSKTDLIGATGDTGGSTTSGTVMGKLNKIIGGSRPELVKKSDTLLKKSITSGFASAVNLSSIKSGASSHYKLMQGFYIDKVGSMRINVTFTGTRNSSSSSSNSTVLISLKLSTADFFTDLSYPLGTNITGVGTEILYENLPLGSDEATVDFNVSISTPGYYTIILSSGTKNTNYTESVTNFQITSVKFYYEEETGIPEI